MTLELDHVFVLTTIGAPTLDRLLDRGFVEGRSNVHPGQGTANRRIFFRNAKLEFLWVDNEADAKSPAIAPTRLWERSRFHDTGFSPYGMCLRWSRPGEVTSRSLPFETWEFRPPYMPPGLCIDVASQGHPSEPMMFVTPFSKRPDRLTGDRAQPLDHPNGCLEITHIRIAIPGTAPLSDAADVLSQAAGIEVVRGTDFGLEVECDRARQGQQYDASPEIPLTLLW